MDTVNDTHLEDSSEAYLTPRERMQLLKQNLVKDEAKERSKPWEKSRMNRKKSHLDINIPHSYRDRPPPASGILRRPSAASNSGSEFSNSPCPSPYSQYSDFGPPVMERRSSKVRFSETSAASPSGSIPSLKRQSSIDALRADLERAKASLTGAMRATMEELTEVEFSLRRLSAEDFDEAFKPRPLRMPRTSSSLSVESSSSFNSDRSDSSELQPPPRPAKSRLRHSISASSGMSSGGSSRSTSISLGSDFDPRDSLAVPTELRGLSMSSISSTSSSISLDLPSGPSYQVLLPRERDEPPSAASPTIRTPTLNRSDWSGAAGISPHSTPSCDTNIAVLPDPPVQVETSPASPTHEKRSSIWSLSNLDFPVPPERVWVFPQYPHVISNGNSPTGESAIIEETASASASPMLELVEPVESRGLEPAVRSASIEESADSMFIIEEDQDPVGTPTLEISEETAQFSADKSPVTPSVILQSGGEASANPYDVPLSFTDLNEDETLSMTLLDAAVECDIISPNSSLVKQSAKVPSRRVTVDLDEADDGWMGSDAEEEDYYNAIRRLATLPTTRRTSSGNSSTSRLSQLSSTSMSSASTLELLTPAPSTSELPSHSLLPSRSHSGNSSPGLYPWGKSSPNASPTLQSKASMTSMRPTTTFQFQKMPKPGLDIEWGPPEVLYDAMDWVWRPQHDSPGASPRITPRASRSVAENDDEDLRNVTVDESTPRPATLDRVPSPPLRLPEGLNDWLLEEQMPSLEHTEVGMAF